MNDERGRRRTRRLTDDERALWDHAAATMTRLERAKGRVHPAVSEPELLPVAKAPIVSSPSGSPRQPPTVPPGKATRPSDGAPRYVPPPYIPPTSQPRRASTPEIANFDGKSARRLRGGRTEIDARIDLHGMRQDEARAALAGFLRSCQARGHRFALVITGKGAPRRSAFSDAMDAWSPDRPDPPGVLRRNVPMWLQSSELRGMVVSYTEAAIQHGRSGALYVQVRLKGL